MSLAYRSDIDGLRAVAVSSVILFHGHIPPFHGGFVGVDVFFVISGFLIASILYRDMEARSFSLVDFYDRRIRRIFPALFVMLAVVTVIAAFVLLPKQMLEYAESLTPSALFYANIHFQDVLNYFGPSADEVPLLHLWSLAVEEQYYIVFPVLLFVLLRAGGRRLAVGALLVIVLASLAYAEFYVENQPKVAFYELASRAWELLVGAALAITPLPKVRASVATGLGVIGLVGVILPVYVYDKHTAFPGLAALPPVLGTALLIYAGGLAPNGIVTRLLSLPIMVYVGRISYSLYLWHWPLLVLAAIYKTRHLTYIQSGLVILVAVAFSALSLKYVETPLRRASLFGGRRRMRIAAGAVAILCAVFVARSFEGVGGQLWPISERGAAALAGLDDRSKFQVDCNNGPENWYPPLRAASECSIGPGAAQGTYDVLVWGDSHAGSSFLGIGDAVAALGHTARVLTMPGCPPLIGGLARQAPDSGESCARFNAAVLEEIGRARPKLVILAGRWVIWTMRAGTGFQLTSSEIPGGEVHSLETSRRAFAHMLQRTLTALDGVGAQVILLGQAPEFMFSPTQCVAQREYFGGDSSTCLTQTRDEIFRLIGFADDALEKAAAAHPHTSVFLLSDLFCDGPTCSAGSLKAGNERFFYVDGDHLSATGSRLALDTDRFRQVLARALSTSVARGQAPPAERTKMP